MAAEAILAFGMSFLQGTLSTFHMTGQAVLLQLDAVMGQVGGNGRVVVARARQQRDEQDDSDNQTDEDQIGFFRAKGHSHIVGAQLIAPKTGGINPAPTFGRVHSPYASFSSSAMWRTSTSPRSPFFNWIMQAGHEVATTCAPLSRIAARLRSKIFCEVS